MSAPETEAEGCFIDTNIWLYAFTVGNDPEKTACAKTLIETQSAIFVSTQVINEVCVNLIKKAYFSEQHIQQLIESFYAKYEADRYPNQGFCMRIPRGADRRPNTSTVREIPSEVLLAEADGMPRECVVNLEHGRTLPKPKLVLSSQP